MEKSFEDIFNERRLYAAYPSRQASATKNRAEAPKNGGIPIKLYFMAIQVVPHTKLRNAKMAYFRNIRDSFLIFQPKFNLMLTVCTHEIIFAMKYD